MVEENVLHDPEVHVLIAMNDHVAEARHVSEVRRQGCLDPAGPDEQVEQLAVGFGLPQTYTASTSAGARSTTLRSLSSKSPSNTE